MEHALCRQLGPQGLDKGSLAEQDLPVQGYPRGRVRDALVHKSAIPMLRFGTLPTKLRQEPVGAESRHAFIESRRSTVATPAVFLGSPDHARPHRIEHNVAAQD